MTGFSPVAFKYVKCYLRVCLYGEGLCRLADFKVLFIRKGLSANLAGLIINIYVLIIVLRKRLRTGTQFSL